MAEPTPGAPGGASGSARAATAATFQVDSQSIKSLTADFKELVRQVDALTNSLVKAGAAGQKVSGLSGGGGGATSGGAAASGLAGETNFTRAGDGRAPNAGDSHFTNTGSSAADAGQQSRSGFMQNPGVRAGLKVGAGVLGAGAMVGGWFNNRMGDISDLNLAYTQGAQGNGMGYSAAGLQAARAQLMGRTGGYQSVQDLLGGVSTITNTIGSTVGTGRSNAITSAVGGLASAMPGMGYAGAAQAAGQLYTPGVTQRLRSMGVTPTGSHGQLKTPQQIYANIIRLVFRGQSIKPQDIAEGMQPGAPLYVTLQAFGLDEAGIEGFREYALVQANLGNSPVRAQAALRAAAQGKSTTDTRAAGLTTSIRFHQNRLGMAEARRTGEAEREGAGGINAGLNALTDVVNATTSGFRHLNSVLGTGGALGATGVLGGPVAGIVQHAGGIGGIGFTISTITNAWRAMHHGGGIRGAARAGGRTALGMSGLQGTPVFVTNWPDGGVGGGGGGGGLLGEVENALGGKTGHALEKRGIGKALSELMQKTPGAALRDLLGGGGGARGVGMLGRLGAFARGIPAMGGGAVGTVALPLAGAAAAGVGLGELASFGIHHGMADVFGVPGDKQIARMNAYANDNSLTKALQSMHAEGYTKLPGFLADWHRIEPQVRTLMAKRSVSADHQAASMIEALKARYKSQLVSSNVSQGKTAGGMIFHSMFAPTGTNSYSIGQPGGAAVGAGSGSQSSGKASNTTPASAPNGAGAIIGTAESFVGRPYRWGGSTPQTSFDCSGLTQWSYGQHGIRIPRVASDQQRVGKPVPLDKLQPADLVFYGNPAHHVAMYVGGGQMVEAPHTGASIRVTSLRPPDGGARRLLTGRNDYSVPPGGASSTPAGSMPGDSGNGPQLMPGGNYAAAPGVFSDESSAFASLMSQTMGQGPVASARLAGVGSTATTGSNAGNAGQNVGSAPNTKIPGTVGTWIKSALGIMHLDFNKYGKAIATIIQHESGGNPRAINLWDSNAKAGHPSKGLMQTIDSTFRAHMMPGHGDIWNPVDNIIAATRYAIGRYGSLDNVPGIYSLNHGGAYKGYYTGSWNTPEGPAYLHSDEMILPARTARKVRSMLKGSSSAGATQQVEIPTQGSGGGAGRPITIHAPITVVGKATQQDARDFLSMVKDEAEKNHTLDAIGAH